MAVVGDVNAASLRRNPMKNGTEGGMQPSTKSTQKNTAELDEEDEEEQKGIWQSIRSYPIGVFFMLGNEFCERFSFYGMRAILIIYLITDHKLPENVAKQIYHAFVSLAYFSPLFGSVLADNFFGRFRVILWVSLVYVFGHVLLSVGAIPFMDDVLRKVLDYSGLAVIAVATGGIKPCVSAFAADQFGDDQHRERTQFFSFFYFAINAGSLIAIGITPILRTVKCLGADQCFPLAFGVPGLLMLIAFLTFLFGWRYYKIAPANKGNILWKVLKCICFALRRKIRNTCCGARTHRRKPDHWLDYASTRYDAHLIAGVKSMLAIVVLYIPIVLFWALYDQQGSTWVLQARRMDGRIGWFTVLPDQINTLNPLIVLILVPIFEAWIYPLMNKLCTVTPLRKMAIGGILAAIAFCMAGFLQIKVNGTMEPQPDESHVFISRLGNYSEQFEDRNKTDVTLRIKNDKYIEKMQLPVDNYTFEISGNNGNINEEFKFDLNLDTTPPKSRVVGIFHFSTSLDFVEFPYSTEKTAEGKTRYYFLLLANSPLNGTKCYALDDEGMVISSSTITNGAYIDIQPGFFSTSEFYNIAYGNCTDGEKPECASKVLVDARMGAAYVIDLVSESENETPIELVRPNSVKILWQVPQLFVMTVGEILLSVTGLEFSYSQAAPSMKSVVQALWLLTVFFGNIIDIIISHAQIPDPVAEFFIYAGLMFVVIGLFIVLAMRYHYVDEHNLEIPDSPERSRRSSDEYSSDRQSDDNLEMGRNGAKSTDGIPPLNLIEKKGSNRN